MFSVKRPGENSELLFSGLNTKLHFVCFQEKEQNQVTGPVLLPVTTRTVLACILPVLAWGKPLSPLFPSLFEETVFFCGAGEAAVPERDPSCPPRPCVALSVRGEDEERAEPRKVSGQKGVSFTSSSLLCLCCILGSFH